MIENKIAVVSTDRTMYFDKEMTIREVKNEIASRGDKLSLGRTFRLYGLRYIEERSFTSKYKQEFELSESKSMYDIKLRELQLYRDLLIGYPIKGG